MLEGAGFTLGPDGIYARSGKRLSFRIRTESATSREVSQQVIQAQVRQAGIELRIDNAPFNVLVSQLANGDFDIEIISYGKGLLGGAGQFRPGNRWAYPNPRPYDLVQRASTELDEARRLPLLYGADAILWDDLRIIPLFQNPQLLAVRDGIVGVEPNTAAPVGAFWNMAHWARSARR